MNIRQYNIDRVEQFKADMAKLENQYIHIRDIFADDLAEVISIVNTEGITEFCISGTEGNILDKLMMVKETGYEVVDLIEVNLKMDIDWYEGSNAPKYVRVPAMLFRTKAYG